MLRHRGREYTVGDVVWTVDPFKLGTTVPRMFAIGCLGWVTLEAINAVMN